MGCVHVNKFSYTKPQVWAVYCWHFSLPSVFSCAWIGQELGRSSSSSSPPRHVARPPPGPAPWPAPPAASAPGSPGSAAQPLRPGCPPWLGEQHRTVGLPIWLPSQPYNRLRGLCFHYCSVEQLHRSYACALTPPSLIHTNIFSDAIPFELYGAASILTSWHTTRHCSSLSGKKHACSVKWTSTWITAYNMSNGYSWMLGKCWG